MDGFFHGQLEQAQPLEVDGGAGGFFCPAVGLAGKFYVEAAGVASVTEGPKERRKFEQARAQREMLVDAGPHVVHVDVDQLARGAAERVGEGPLAHALHVAKVDGQFERIGMAHSLPEFVKAGERVDEHAGLGLESQGHASAGRMIEHGLEARREPVPERAFTSSVVDHTAPERHAAGAEVGRKVDRPPQKVDPPLSVGGVCREQRGFVLLQRVKKVPGSCFDNTGERMFFEHPPPGDHLFGKARLVGIQQVSVGGDRQ